MSSVIKYEYLLYMSCDNVYTICHRIHCTDSYDLECSEKVLSRMRGLGNICVYISIDSQQRAGQFLKLRLNPKADWGQGSQM